MLFWYDDVMKTYDEILTASLQHPLADFLHSRAIISCGPDATVREAVESMRQHKIGCVVVTKNDVAIGIFTERDFLFRFDMASLDFLSEPVSDHMTEAPKFVRDRDHLADAVQLLSGSCFRHVVVTGDQNTLVGVLSIKDVLHMLVSSHGS